MKLYQTALAAEFLNDKLPKSLAYWQNFLLNNRKLNRNPAYRIPCDKLSGYTVYSEKELLHFIEWEKYRKNGSIGLSRYTYLHKMNFDFNESSTRFSHKFTGFFSTEVDSKTYKPFISLKLHHPKPTYILTLDEAIYLRNQLDEVINKLK